MRGKKDAAALAKAWLHRLKTLDIQLNDITTFVTDSAGVNVSAMQIFEEDESVKHIFWIPCVAHVMDLILEDIGSIGWVASPIAQARLVTKFFNRHNHTREALETKTKLKLLLPTKTRFSTNVIMMRRLLDKQTHLMQVVTEDPWRNTVWATRKVGQDVAEITACAGSPPWREDLRRLCRFMNPVMDMLQMLDSNIRQISKVLRRYEIMIASCLTPCDSLTTSKQDEILEVFDGRRTMFRTPAHIAAMMLDLEVRNTTLPDDDVMQQGLVAALVQFDYPERSPQHIEVLTAIDKFHARERPFDNATMDRAMRSYEHPRDEAEVDLVRFPRQHWDGGDFLYHISNSDDEDFFCTVMSGAEDDDGRPDDDRSDDDDGDDGAGDGRGPRSLRRGNGTGGRVVVAPRDAVGDGGGLDVVDGGGGAQEEDTEASLKDTCTDVAMDVEQHAGVHVIDSITTEAAGVDTLVPRMARDLASYACGTGRRGRIRLSIVVRHWVDLERILVWEHHRRPRVERVDQDNLRPVRATQSLRTSCFCDRGIAALVDGRTATGRSACGMTDVPFGTRSIGAVDSRCHGTMREYEDQHGRRLATKTSDVAFTRVVKACMLQARNKGGHGKSSQHWIRRGTAPRESVHGHTQDEEVVAHGGGLEDRQPGDGGGSRRLSRVHDGSGTAADERRNHAEGAGRGEKRRGVFTIVHDDSSDNPTGELAGVDDPGDSDYRPDESRPARLAYGSRPARMAHGSRPARMADGSDPGGRRLRCNATLDAQGHLTPSTLEPFFHCGIVYY
ncbi:hypothetical protein CBR_g40136 [Chara braunii]|uniref:DUF659 domain-containing protein n=1 Tax=Chara braunii TaxID=69332 RepID=A0A388LT59_CHABU|nr:hypothetical protein CBR_g40136 [Chara braunii]|eukprot:GBG85497.1 hypothetical protein CBR_g40136 [Chara braunii]